VQLTSNSLVCVFSHPAFNFNHCWAVQLGVNGLEIINTVPQVSIYKPDLTQNQFTRHGVLHYLLTGETASSYDLNSHQNFIEDTGNHTWQVLGLSKREIFWQKINFQHMEHKCVHAWDELMWIILLIKLQIPAVQQGFTMFFKIIIHVQPVCSD
jgi:hypothetical protein